MCLLTNIAFVPFITIKFTNINKFTITGFYLLLYCISKSIIFFNFSYTSEIISYSDCSKQVVFSLCYKKIKENKYKMHYSVILKFI